MAFTFTNYAGIKPQQSPFADIIGKMLGGYTDMTKARYLQPDLEEELKKKKLFNQYYGKDIESQIGLRGAQAGHLGSLTNQTNIQNRSLGERLAAELAHQKLVNQYYGPQASATLDQTKASTGLTNAQLQAAQEAARKQKIINDLISGGITGTQGGLGSQNAPNPQYSDQMNTQAPPQPEQQYAPGQGMAPFAQANQGEVKQANTIPQEEPQLEMIQQPAVSQSPPQPTVEDLRNKVAFGQDSYTPKLEAWKKKREAVDKEIEGYKHEVPVLLDALKDFDFIGRQIKAHPEWFGPGTGGFDILGGPKQRERSINDPDFGKVKEKLNTIIAKGEQKLSSKPLALALKTAIANKMQFSDNPDTAYGNVQSGRESLLHALYNADQVAFRETGKHIVDPKKLQKEIEKIAEENAPPVKVIWNGKVHNVPRKEAHKFVGKEKEGVYIVK